MRALCSFSAVLLLFMVAPSALASNQFDMCGGGGPRITCVVDGDTFWLDGEKIRISNIDTPEVGGASCIDELGLAVHSTRRLSELLRAGGFELVREGQDHYGRTLARVVNSAGQDLGETLISEGLARPWTGRRESWC